MKAEKTVKIVTNRCYGGFGLSQEAQDMYAEAKNFKIYRYQQTKYKHKDSIDEYTKVKDKDMFVYTLKEDLGDIINNFPARVEWFTEYDINRDDPELVQIVQELGEKANGNFAELEITEIPEGVNWEIEEYDGQEWVAEVHQRW